MRTRTKLVSDFLGCNSDRSGMRNRTHRRTINPANTFTNQTQSSLSKAGHRHLVNLQLWKFGLIGLRT